MKSLYKKILIFSLIYLLLAPSLLRFYHFLSHPHNFTSIRKEQKIKSPDNFFCNVFHKKVLSHYTYTPTLTIELINTLFDDCIDNKILFSKKEFFIHFHLRAPPVILS